MGGRPKHGYRLTPARQEGSGFTTPRPIPWAIPAKELVPSALKPTRARGVPKEPMRLTLAFPILAVLGCTASTGTVSVLRVSITASTTHVTAGLPVTLHIVAFNEGDRPISVHLPTCVPSFEALDAGGTPVGPGDGIICTADLPAPTVVPPGRSVSLVRSWLTRTGPALHQVPLASGTYRVRATNFRVLPGAVSRYDETLVSVSD